MDDDSNLPPNWLATMQLAWEQPVGTNNMVRCHDQFAHVCTVFALSLTPLLTFIFTGRTFRGGKIGRQDGLLGCYYR